MEESKVLFIMGLMGTINCNQGKRWNASFEALNWGMVCAKKNLRGASYKKFALQAACLTFRLFSLLVDFHTFSRPFQSPCALYFVRKSNILLNLQDCFFSRY